MKMKKKRKTRQQQPLYLVHENKVQLAHLEKGRVREVLVSVSYVQIPADYQRSVVPVHKVSHVGIPLLPGPGRFQARAGVCVLGRRGQEAQGMRYG